MFYCLIDGKSLRVPGGASLGVGQAVLVNADDRTAAILVRDHAGFYALSAICTHQCCLLSICEDAACSRLLTNPGDCAYSAAPADVASTGPLLFCSCHGSEFAADGTALKGPAVDPLPAVFVAIQGPDVVIDTAQSVDPAQRAS